MIMYVVKKAAGYPQSEVTDINKQKFLAELGKLLTFMYDEDRLAALEEYGRMFDAARDEQALMQLLISPTRQAVVIARAYNARERKLQVNTQSKDGLYDGAEEDSDYLRAIRAIEKEARDMNIIAPDVPVEQFTLFADGVHPVEGEDDAAEVSAQAAAPAEGAPFTADETAEAELRAEQDAAAGEASDASAISAEGEADDVDAFLAEFSFSEGALDAAQTEESPAPAEGAAVTNVEAEEALPEFDAPAPQEKRRESGKSVPLTARRANVPLLILYIIIALPVAGICVLMLLLPTFFALGMAACAVSLGCMALSSAFGAFTIFADVMVVLGAALVILAVGLFFLWLFVWLIGGAIAGLINALIKLGGKWCYKEVPAV